jgi:RHS repeat-associated protein
VNTLTLQQQLDDARPWAGWTPARRRAMALVAAIAVVLSLMPLSLAPSSAAGRGWPVPHPERPLGAAAGAVASAVGHASSVAVAATGQAITSASDGLMHAVTTAGARLVHAAGAVHRAPAPPQLSQRRSPERQPQRPSSSSGRVIPSLLGVGAGVGVGVAATVATAAPAAAAANPTINNAAVTSPATLTGSAGSVAIPAGTSATAYVAIPGSAGTGGSIKKVTLSTGAVAAVAGGAAGSCANGTTAATSSFGAIKAIATDGTNVYSVGDCSSAIRKTVISTGATSTLSTGVAGANYLTIVGTTLYVTASNAVWKVTTSGTITATKWVTLATGITAAAITPDVHTASPAPSALYVAEDTGTTHQIQKIVISSAAVTTLAGASPDLGLGALLGYSGYVYDGAAGGRVVRAYNPADGTWTNIAGSGSAGNADGTGTEAWFAGITGMAVDGTALWLADSANNKLRKAASGTALTSAQPTTATTDVAVSPGAATTVAGNGANATADNATGTSASLKDMGGAARVGATTYVGTVGAIRSVGAAAGSPVATLAGSATLTGCVDSATAGAARFGAVADVATDTFYLYVSDASCGIRRVSVATGATSTVTASYGGAKLTFGNGMIYAASGSAVVAVNRVNGTATTLVTLAGPASAITSDAASVFVVDTVAGASRIEREAFTGGAPVVVASDSVGTAALSSAGAYLYDATGSVLRRYKKADGTWVYVAGSDVAGYADNTGAFAAFSSVTGVVSDGTSTVWVADSGNHRMRTVVNGTWQSAAATAPVAVNPAAMSALAGSGTNSTVDGTGPAASFSNMGGAAVVGGFAYQATAGAIRKVNLATGDVSTLAGSASATGCTASTTASAVRISGSVAGVVTDGYFLYVADPGCSALWRTSLSTGATNLVTSTGSRAVAFGPDGSLYFDSGSSVMKLAPGGTTPSVFANPGTVSALNADGTYLWATITLTCSSSPCEMQINRIALADGTITTYPSTNYQPGDGGLLATRDYLYGATAGNTGLIRYSKADLSFVVIAGRLPTASAPGYAEGTGPDAWFSSVAGIATDGTNLFVADSGNHRLRMGAPGTAASGQLPPGSTAALNVNPGQVTTLAGSGTNADVDGTGSGASFSNLSGPVVVGGYAYVGAGTAIRKIQLSTGTTSTLAGSLTASAYVDSPTASLVRFPYIQDMTTDGTYLYTVSGATLSNYRNVRRTSLTTGATSTLFQSTNDLSAIAYGPGGFLYAMRAAEAGCCGNSFGHIFKIDPANGTSTDILPPTTGFTLYGLTADATSLWTVKTTSGGFTLQQVDPTTGVMTAVGSSNGSNAARLASSQSYIYAALGNQVRRISKADGSWVNVAGTTASGFADGTGSDAWFKNIAGLVSDGSNLWVADSGNRRFRRVVPGTAPGGSVSSTLTTTLTIDAGQVSTFAGKGSSPDTNGTGTGANLTPNASVVIGGVAYVGANAAIRKVDLTTGAVSTFSGSTTDIGYVDSADPTVVRFNSVFDLTTDGTYLYSLTGDQLGGYRDIRRTSLATGATSTILQTSDSVSHIVYGPGGAIYAVQSMEGGCCSIAYGMIHKVDPVNGTFTDIVPEIDGTTMHGITADATNLWVTEGPSPKLVRVDPTTGVQTTVNTSPSSESFQTVTSAGNFVYVGIGNGVATQINRFDKTTGATTLIAGSTGSGSSGFKDGLVSAANFAYIAGLTSDGTNLWVSDYSNKRLRRIIPGPLGGMSVTDTPTGSNICATCLAKMNEALSGVTYYPVNVQWGNFFHTFGDLSIPGRGNAINLARTYNSDAAFSAVDSPFGYGWSSSYGISLAAGPTQTVIHQEDGSQVTFDLSGSVWVPHVPRTIATLTHNGNGTWTFVRKAAETVTFDSTGRLSALSDRNGYVTAVTYPTSSTQVITDPAGRTLTLTFTGAHITSAADSAGRTLTYTYGGSGNLTDVIDVGGGHWVFTYDTSHRMLTMRYPKFYGDTTTTPTPVVTNHYNASGWVDWQSDPLGRVTSFDYTTVPGSTKISDPKGNVTLNTYSSGFLTSVTKGYGTAQAATWAFGYDPITGSPTEVFDPNGHVSSVYVDSNGNPTATVDALGRVTKTTYNAFNEPTSVTDPAGVTTTASYDTAGNVMSRSTPLLAADGVTVLTNQTTTYNYGGTTPVYAGDVTSIVDPLGKTWTYRYDTYGDPVSTTAPPTPENASGNKTTYAYDTARGWLTSTVAPKGNLSGANPSDYTTTIGHDLYGRVTSTKDPLWSSATPLLHQATQHYDANGNLDSSVDANGNGTSYTYDAAGQLLTVTRPDTTTLRNDYWADGSLHNQYDGANQATTYAYDALGRLTSTTDPLVRVTTYTYDPAGTLLSKKDPGGSCPSSACTTRTYDAANQLTGITYSDGTTPNVSGLQYDADGRRTRMTDGTGTSVWAYDSLGRLTTSTNGASSSLGYTYDIANRPTGLAYPGGTQNVTRSYDDAGRLSSVTDWSSRATSFTYDANSNLVGTTYPNGTSVASSVDRTDAMMGSTLTGPGPTTLASLTYTRDGAGQLASQSGTGLSQPSESYGYNGLEQLSTVNGSAALAYDHADNLTQLRGATQAYDVASELTSSTPSGGSATAYGYDTRGNRTSMTAPASSAVPYGYDQANRLTNFNSGAATYAYDGNGMRASKTVAGVGTAFTWDVSGGLPLAVKAGTTSYVYGPGGLPLEQVASDGTTQWLFHDQLGSTRALTDSSGAVVGTWAYDPYGKVVASSGTATTPFGFTGEWTDAETGFVYLRARYYDPATGQFLSRDPLAAITGSAYGYVFGDPLNGIDPSGMVSVWSIAKEAVTHPIKSFEAGWDSMTTTEKVADASLPVVAPIAVAACWFYCPAVIAGGAAGAQRVSQWIDDHCPWAGDDTGAIGGSASDPQQTVNEILKSKLGSITRAALPPGSPSWDDIREKTLGEIQELARANQPGYRTILKLLNNNEYNKP